MYNMHFNQCIQLPVRFAAGLLIRVFWSNSVFEVGTGSGLNIKVVNFSKFEP